MIDVFLRTIRLVPKLGTHSLQVGFITSELARQFNLDEQEAFYAGFLHDIGTITPFKGVVLDDIDNVFLMTQDIPSAQDPTREHTLISSFSVSKISFLTKRFPNLTSAILLHHAIPQFIDSSKASLLANIISIAEEISKYTLVNDEELSFEEFYVPLSSIQERFLPEVFECAISQLKKEYFRWMVYDIKNSVEREEILREFELNEKMTFDEIVEMGAVLSYIIDAKSPFTREHSWRVAKISSAIAKEIFLDEKEFFVAGLFHDIGKITTPVNILEKKGKLESKEREIIQKHVYYSEIILKNHSHEPWFLPAVRHQERIDGTGYPRKLTGSEMSLKDKILQVADYFVAVLEPRPYRGENTPEVALNEVLRAVENKTLDITPANILKDLVLGRYNFSDLGSASKIQKEIYEFEKGLIKAYGEEGQKNDSSE